MKTPEEVSSSIKAELARKGKTEKELAQAIGISDSTLRRKLKDGGEFSLREIGRIARVLHIDGNILLA